MNDTAYRLAPVHTLDNWPDTLPHTWAHGGERGVMVDTWDTVKHSVAMGETREHISTQCVLMLRRGLILYGG